MSEFNPNYTFDSIMEPSDFNSTASYDDFLNYQNLALHNDSIPGMQGLFPEGPGESSIQANEPLNLAVVADVPCKVGIWTSLEVEAITYAAYHFRGVTSGKINSIVADEVLGHILRGRDLTWIRSKESRVSQSREFKALIENGTPIRKPVVMGPLIRHPSVRTADAVAEGRRGGGRAGGPQSAQSEPEPEPEVYGFIRHELGSLEDRLDTKLDIKVAAVVNPRFDTIERLIEDRFPRP